MPLLFIIKADAECVPPVAEHQFPPHQLCTLQYIGKLIQKPLLQGPYTVYHKGIKPYAGHSQKQTSIGPGLLLLAIFMTQTTVFYGFTTKLGDRKYSKAIAWAVGLAGYVCSLYGYYNFVANIVPIVGYISLAFFALEIVNLIRVRNR